MPLFPHVPKKKEPLFPHMPKSESNIRGIEKLELLPANPGEFLPPPHWDEPPIPEAFLKQFGLTPERILLIQEINNLIRQRTRYGLRTEVITRHPAYILSWSNARAEWYVGRAQPKGSVSVDANQIVVQGAKKADIEAVLRWLDTLPLYAFSFEAKQRGIYDPLGHLRAYVESWRRGEL